MISDKERKEVAENLRYLSYRNRVRYKEEFFELLDETVMEPDLGYHEMNDVFERLADLIDRPKCEMTREGEGFRCSACGAFHDMSGFDEFPWPRCPNCGAEVTCNG